MIYHSLLISILVLSLLDFIYRIFNDEYLKEKGKWKKVPKTSHSSLNNVGYISTIYFCDKAKKKKTTYKSKYKQ